MFPRTCIKLLLKFAIKSLSHLLLFWQEFLPHFLRRRRRSVRPCPFLSPLPHHYFPPEGRPQDPLPLYGNNGPGVALWTLLWAPKASGQGQDKGWRLGLETGSLGFKQKQNKSKATRGSQVQTSCPGTVRKGEDGGVRAGDPVPVLERGVWQGFLPSRAGSDGVQETQPQVMERNFWKVPRTSLKTRRPRC